MKSSSLLPDLVLLLEFNMYPQASRVISFDTVGVFACTLYSPNDVFRKDVVLLLLCFAYGHIWIGSSCAVLEHVSV